MTTTIFEEIVAIMNMQCRQESQINQRDEESNVNLSNKESEIDLDYREKAHFCPSLAKKFAAFASLFHYGQESLLQFLGTGDV